MKKARAVKTARTRARTGSKPASRTRTALRTFVPYTVEMVTVQKPQPPIKHYVSVDMNGQLYVIELHKENPRTRTSHGGFYGQHWAITKVKSDKAKTEYTVTLAGGRITRYTVLTRMARKLEKDIAVYETQQEHIARTATDQKKNRNDHYVSQVLLRRFTNNGRLQKYTLKYGHWSPSAPKSVFSEIGYNQLLAFGKFNTDLDDRLKEFEDTLPITLAALD